MSKKGWAVGVIAFLTVVGSCSHRDDTPAPAAAPSYSVPSSAAAPRGVAAVPVDDGSTSAEPVAESAGVAVTRVIDGDTFEIAGGQRVRVLGIDSCEVSTYGGRQAKDAAELWLDDENVVLTEEPGVDRDSSGRLLRYVATSSGTDFGELMVVYPHTGAYEGRNNVSATRLADLRAGDSGGRDCAEPDTTPSSGGSDVDIDLDGDGGLPDGALTGGYCARKWWC